jgi:MraZ protein
MMHTKYGIQSRTVYLYIVCRVKKGIPGACNTFEKPEKCKKNVDNNGWINVLYGIKWVKVGESGKKMTRFRGTFENAIDGKGRLNIPAKFRRALSPEADETFVIIRGPDNCLQAYPQDAWKSFEDEIESRPQTPETIRLKRYIYRSLTDVKIDAQGRIMLSTHQMQLAGITDRAILIGQSRYFEIWSPQRYNAFIGDEDDFDTVYYQSIKDSIAGGRT